MDDRDDDDDDDAKKKSDDVEEGGKEVLSRFLEDAAKAQEKDYLNSMRVGNSKSMKELARYDAGQNMEMRREMKKEKRGDDPNEEEERRRVVVAETEQLRSASRMMTANDEDDLNLDGKHQSSFADLNYNSSGSDFTRGAAAPEIYRSLFTRRREMEEEEEEEEEGWEEPRGSDAYFSKHFNNHPCSPGSGGRRNTTDRNFNSIGLGFGGSARDLERQRQSQTMILQQHQRWSENYDDLKNEKEDTKFFLRQSYTESDFEDDDDDGGGGLRSGWCVIAAL